MLGEYAVLEGADALVASVDRYVIAEINDSNDDFYEELYSLLIELRQEIIGFDFKENSQNKEFFITFLLDTTKKKFLDVVKDLANIFKTIIENIVEGAKKKKF